MAEKTKLKDVQHGSTYYTGVPRIFSSVASEKGTCVSAIYGSSTVTYEIVDQYIFENLVINA